MTRTIRTPRASARGAFGEGASRGVARSPFRTSARAQDIYEELFELAPDAYLFTTPAGRILHANRAACALLNCSRARLHGAPLVGFISARQYGRLLADLPSPGLDRHSLPEREVSVRPPHRPALPAAVTVGVARDGAGRRVGLRWMLRDVTERKRVEARLQASVHEKEVLLREVYHRVKNNLQVISSLLSLQEIHLTDPAATAVLRHARDRVRSMALVHERLYRSSDLTQVDFGEYLRELARELRHSYGAHEIRFVFDLHQAGLGIDVAIPCSMIVHELVSNALRHAFPGGGPGRIEIALIPEAPAQARLTVADDGAGLPAADEPPRSGSLGLQLVQMMVEQIGGRMDVRRTPGARFDIVFPLGGAPGAAGGAR
ncbi:MAG TPA: histidine kinase dimerization/phosphoacceptor domain -containing protein [Vicinamibacteria bacterium]